jgi:hypothetical protein
MHAHVKSPSSSATSFQSVMPFTFPFPSLSLSLPTCRRFVSDHVPIVAIICYLQTPYKPNIKEENAVFGRAQCVRPRTPAQQTQKS